MTAPRALSVNECATLNPTRANAWRWLSTDELYRHASGYTGIPLRTVRYHARRFHRAGVLVYSFELPGIYTRHFWRWNVDADPAVVAALEALGDLVPVVADAPVTCARGHVYTGADRYPDGYLLCQRCTHSS
jgi:hypothetical protein